MAEVRLHRAKPNGFPPLYHRYPGQYRPQSAFIELDLSTGNLSAAWNEDPGNAVPDKVRHRCVLRWSVPIYLSGDEVNHLLEEIAPVARRLLDGSEMTWDGSNYTGRLSTEAATAEEEIDAICAQAEGSVTICTPEEWLVRVPTENLLEPGETVVHAAARIKSLAWTEEETFIDGDLVSCLTERLAGLGGDAV